MEAVADDLNRPDTLAPHLDGVTAAFLLSGYDGLADTLARMRGAGVERVVLLSSSAAPGGDLTNAVARYHILSERAVDESGLPWTFLRPNSFMSNAYRWLPQLRVGDVVRLPFADVPIAMLHRDDLGRVAAAALTTSGHEGRAYRLSGPEPLRPADQVAILARAVGRHLRFEAQPDDEARADMAQAMPPEYVEAFFQFFAEGASTRRPCTPPSARSPDGSRSPSSSGRTNTPTPSDAATSIPRDHDLRSSRARHDLPANPVPPSSPR